MSTAWLKRETGERLPSGVRRRADGGGSTFGRLHRERLGTHALMSDLDAVMVLEGRTFAEYCIQGESIAFCALFDLKASEKAAGIVPLRKKVLCALARSIAHSQPCAPLAFEAVGLAEPFTLWELSLTTATRTGRRWYLTADSWPSVWEECGIADTRRRLEAWLRKNEQKRTYNAKTHGGWYGTIAR